MTGRNINIYLREETYEKLLPLIRDRKISRFANEAFEEKLAKVKSSNQVELEKKIVEGYQQRAKNKPLQKMLQAYGEMSLQDLNAKLKNGQSKK